MDLPSGNTSTKAKTLPEFAELSGTYGLSVEVRLRLCSVSGHRRRAFLPRRPEWRAIALTDSCTARDSRPPHLCCCTACISLSSRAAPRARPMAGHTVGC